MNSLFCLGCPKFRSPSLQVQINAPCFENVDVGRSTSTAFRQLVVDVKRYADKLVNHQQYIWLVAKSGQKNMALVDYDDLEEEMEVNADIDRAATEVEKN